jgi:hypothetical protein
MQGMKRLQKIAVVALTLLGGVSLGLSATPIQATAGVPHAFAYQGRLYDSSGNLLGGTGTTYCFKFSIWDNATAGTGSRVWPSGAPGATQLTVKSGVFSANIGTDTPDTLDYNFNDNDTTFLQVEVAPYSSGCGSFETLSPRKRMVAAPFAINSERVGGALPGTAANTVLKLSSNGSINLTDTSPQINASGSNSLTLQGSSQTGDIQFYGTSNKITSGGALTISGLLTANGGVSSPGVGTASEHVGASSAAAGTYGSAFGNSATASSTSATALGYLATASNTSAISIGSSSQATALSSISIGTSSSATGAKSVVLGHSAGASGTGALAVGYGTNSGYDNSIALGNGATTSAANQFVVGGTASGEQVSQVIIGNGTINSSPVGFTLQATGGSGNNTVGAVARVSGGTGSTSATNPGIGGNLELTGGLGGDATTVGGNVLLKTAPVTSGQTPVVRVQVKAGGETLLTGNASNQRTLIVQGVASQSVNVFEVQDSGTSTLVAVDQSGNLVVNGTGTHTFAGSIRVAAITSSGALAISSGSNGDITIYPNGSGAVKLGSSSNNISINAAGVQTNSGTAITDRSVDTFSSIQAAGVATVHALTVCTGSSTVVSSAITQPDVPRTISITDNNADGTNGLVTVTGTLADGSSSSEGITISDNGTATGSKAFAQITSFTLPAACAATTSISIGTGDKLGLSNSLHGQNTVYKVKKNTADLAIPTVDTTNSTVDLTTITANDTVTVWYKY